MVFIVLMVIVYKDKENKPVFLYRMVTILLLLIVPLLHTLYKGTNKCKTMIHIIVVEKAILLDVNSIMNAVVGSYV